MESCICLVAMAFPRTLHRHADRRCCRLFDHESINIAAAYGVNVRITAVRTRRACTQRSILPRNDDLVIYLLRWTNGVVLDERSIDSRDMGEPCFCCCELEQ